MTDTVLYAVFPFAKFAVIVVVACIAYLVRHKIEKPKEKLPVKEALSYSGLIYFLLISAYLFIENFLK